MQPTSRNFIGLISSLSHQTFWGQRRIKPKYRPKTSSATVKHKKTNVQSVRFLSPIFRQPNSPLINRLINDRLLDAWPTVNQTLPQLIEISHRLSIGPILQHCPYCAIHRTKVWDVKQPFGCYEVRHLATKQFHHRAHTVLLRIIQY